MKRVQIIGHDTANADNFTGKLREVTVDITKKEVRVHDGITKGGIPVARADFSNVNLSTVISKSMEQNTVAFFAQPNAPLGWVALDEENDMALRIVNATGVGGDTGGIHGLSSPPSTTHNHTGPSHTHLQANHQHEYSDVIAHTHSVNQNSLIIPYLSIASTRWTGDGGGSGAVYPYTFDTNNSVSHNHGVSVNSAGTATGTTANDGGGGATGSSGTGNTGDTSPTAFQPKYIDVIKCKKS